MRGRGAGARGTVALVVAMLALASCAARFDVDGARAHLRVVHQVEAGPRIPGTPGHAAIEAWILSELERLGARTEVHRALDSTLVRPVEIHNLIGHYGPPAGSAPGSKAGRRIALVAHWDTRPWSDQDPDTSRRRDPVPGANDGASGVAVLLEVAEALHANPPKVAVDLVFVDVEDQGRPSAAAEFCLGSRAYAEHVRSAPTRPDAVFVFDMVGGRDLKIYDEATSAARAANLVAIVHEAASATRARGFHPEVRHSVYDDHMPFLEASIPAVDIIDFDYPKWHCHDDDASQVAPASLAEVARVAVWIVTESSLAHP